MKSDRRLREDVINELKWDPSVNDANISVKAKSGLLILSGHVDSLSEKVRAETAVKRVAGVKALEIRLEVKLLYSTEREDEDIAKSAENVVRWSNDLRNNSVNIVVEKGWITLTGFVAWAFQKQNIGFSLQNLMGVVGIRNLISIESKASNQAIKSEIEKTLLRHGEAFTEQVAISVNGAEVTLSGAVYSWAERDLIAHIAWHTAGVKLVHNQITIL